eukprot:CAMPEP_0197450942 /NCGR_PEP_ID=MMETSP1175-20131217/27134_1 /TAXON_ID=1003142 /ORGANISM="Triceratium dubium, Strain CCMP147" /LENGTH=403 /DNA_ID=CAMNT_0042983505 /DNA_START=296 /DNA_END=1507 /DNA_ORIENTATION=+
MTPMKLFGEEISTLPPEDGTPCHRRRIPRTKAAKMPRHVTPRPFSAVAGTPSRPVSPTPTSASADAEKPVITEPNSTELAAVIASMKRQEEAYYLRDDYLQMRNLGQQVSQGGCRLPCGLSEGINSRRQNLRQRGDTSPPNAFTANCRRKMCVWCYSTVDHFGLPREVASVAFSILDIFLSRCDCDLTVFKLAAMTCLYIAAKMSSRERPLLPGTLAALSRNEFEDHHFCSMERIILDTLEWRVNPPTAGAFVDHLVRLIPIKDASMREAISQHAHFFAELSVLDYYFVPERSSAVALICVMNAIEGMDILTPRVARAVRRGFLRDVERNAAMDHIESIASCNDMRERLWGLYISTNSSPGQYCAHASEDESAQLFQIVDNKASANVSPVSVSIENDNFLMSN